MKNETGTRISICHETHTHTHTKTSVGHFQDNGEVVMHEGSIQYHNLGPVYISSPVTTDFNAAS